MCIMCIIKIDWICFLKSYLIYIKSFILKKIKMSESNSQEKELNNSILNDYAYPYKW